MKDRGRLRANGAFLIVNICIMLSILCQCNAFREGERDLASYDTCYITVFLPARDCVT